MKDTAITKNIFDCGGSRSRYIKKLYDLLMTREWVSYADVLARDDDRKTPEEWQRTKLSAVPTYGELKKAFSQLVARLKAYDPECIEDNGVYKSGKKYRYNGASDDPLAEERQATVKKSLEDYVTYSKLSASFLPPSLFSSFFEKTQVLLDVKHGEIMVEANAGQNLKNIELLPRLYEAIVRKQVLNFSYQPFGEKVMTFVFHPQFLKEYNRRWFVMGKETSQRDLSPYYPLTVALDRIVGEVNVLNDREYQEATPGFYAEYFEHIIGVTHEEGQKLEHVVIRTFTAYLHGLILTKPIHHSQKESLPFGKHADGEYGEITLDVEPNRELRGQIMHYGNAIEVVAPESLRLDIRDELEKQLKNYKKSPKK